MENLTKPTTLANTFCNSGDKTETIPTTDLGTNAASLAKGFPVITSTATSQGGIPPKRTDFNGILNLLSQYCFFMQNGGSFEYDAEVATAIGGYPQGAILRFYEEDGSYLVKSLVDNNTTAPTTSNIKYKSTDENKVWECIEKVVIKSFSNGYSWYRLYSDGWCEQGGRILSAGSNRKETEIVFLKPFADTTYFTSFTAEQETGTNPSMTDDICLTTKNITNSSVKLFAYDAATNNYNFYCRWRAEGYVSKTAGVLLSIDNIQQPSGAAIVEQIGEDITVNANDNISIELAGAGTSNTYRGGMLTCNHIFTSSTVLRLKKIRGRYDERQIGLVLFTYNGVTETPILAAGSAAMFVNGNDYGGSGFQGGDVDGDEDYLYSGYGYDGSIGGGTETTGACGRSIEGTNVVYAYGGSGYVHSDFTGDTATITGSGIAGNMGLAYARISKI